MDIFEAMMDDGDLANLISEYGDARADLIESYEQGGIARAEDELQRITGILHRRFGLNVRRDYQA